MQGQYMYKMLGSQHTHRTTACLSISVWMLQYMTIICISSQAAKQIVQGAQGRVLVMVGMGCF